MINNPNPKNNPNPYPNTKPNAVQCASKCPEMTKKYMHGSVSTLRIIFIFLTQKSTKQLLKMCAQF